MKRATFCIVIVVLFLIGCEKNSPPTCEIISPENAARIISGELVTFSIDAHDSDGSIIEVKLYIDNIEIASVENLPYDFSWETGDAEIGRHDIRAVAIDDEKDEGEAGIVIDIFEAPPDLENPVVELVTPIEDSTLSGTINILTKAYDNIGVEYVDFMIKEGEVDWILFEKDSTNAFFEYSASLITTDYLDGLNIISIEAYDAAGNCGKYSFDVFINNSGDEEAPLVELIEPLNNDTVSGHIVLRAIATDNVGVDHVNFNILKGTWILIDTDYFAINENEYAILVDTKTIPDGTYGIEAAAFDEVGNKGKHQIGITIDNSGSIAGDDSFIYERRKYYYKTIGTQTWMTENLAYLPSITYSGTDPLNGPRYHVYDYRGTSTETAKHSANYIDYGVLYNWRAAKNACPPGWHLPSDDEWKILEKFLGMSSSDADSPGVRISGDVGRKLKSTSGWANYGNGNNISGFNVLPGGIRNKDYKFVYLGSAADFWTSSMEINDNVWGRSLSNDSDGVKRTATLPRSGYSVRCIKDD